MHIKGKAFLYATNLDPFPFYARWPSGRCRRLSWSGFPNLMLRTIPSYPRSCERSTRLRRTSWRTTRLLQGRARGSCGSWMGCRRGWNWSWHFRGSRRRRRRRQRARIRAVVPAGSRPCTGSASWSAPRSTTDRASTLDRSRWSGPRGWVVARAVKLLTWNHQGTRGSSKGSYCFGLVVPGIDQAARLAGC